MNIQTKDGTMYEFAPTSNKKQIRANYLLVCEQSRHNQLQKARREIAEGRKAINYKNYSECTNCWGTGWFKGADCTWCSGKGFIPNISVDNVLFLAS